MVQCRCHLRVWCNAEKSCILVECRNNQCNCNCMRGSGMHCCTVKLPKAACSLLPRAFSGKPTSGILTLMWRGGGDKQKPHLHFGWFFLLLQEFYFFTGFFRNFYRVFFLTFIASCHSSQQTLLATIIFSLKKDGFFKTLLFCLNGKMEKKTDEKKFLYLVTAMSKGYGRTANSWKLQTIDKLTEFIRRPNPSI